MAQRSHDKLIKIFSTIFIVSASLYLVVSFFCCVYLENNKLFFPRKEITATPASRGLMYDDIYFSSRDKTRLNMWFVPHDEKNFVILFIHGNAGNMSSRLKKIALLRMMGFGVVIYDPRGYGRSGGTPSEEGLYDDAGAAYDYLTDKLGVRPERVILYGESLGGAVAVDLAARKNISGLIAEGAFTSIKDMAHIRYPLLPGFMVYVKFDSLSKIGRVHCPKLFIHSLDDQVVPIALGKRLFEAAAPPKTFLCLRGWHQTSIFDSLEKFKKGVADFLNEVKRAQGQ